MNRRTRTEGARVLISGRSDETIRAALAELGDQALGVVADSTDLADLDKVRASKQRAVLAQADTLLQERGGRHGTGRRRRRFTANATGCRIHD